METLRRTNLSDAVYQHLLTMIRDGRLKPGDRLPSELELTKKLGVSRTALREGIKALAGINMLVIMPGRGTFVNDDPDILVGPEALEAALQGETLKSVNAVRRILDTGIARHAAVAATDQDLQAMASALHTMEASLQSDPPDKVLASEGDEAFHLALCAATHNKILEKIAWPLVSHAMLRRWRTIRFTADSIRWALEGHREIYDAICKRDPDGAAERMVRHLELGDEKFYNRGGKENAHETV